MKQTMYCLRYKPTGRFAWYTMSPNADGAWKAKDNYEDNVGYIGIARNSDYECVQLEIEERNIVGE